MDFQTLFELFFLLLVGHAVCDYALQNDFMAMAKNHTTELGKIYWKFVLPSHGLIHGGWVYFATGSIAFGVLETIIHCITDYLKCGNKISFNTDQWIHIACKVLWVILVGFQFDFLDLLLF
ncbi:membrane protein [Pseudomonas phage PhiPA3]|uniref:Uncharacterized protein 229 n=1 Tax=Pseudomonas phage PhiPA3 TaxID=998086 RepID=F8SJ72_BPPA3|nr:membrane protein [Pseudomonas phage PhiPA3]AEH03652.1 hypothetical protein [Pseudomonas phage PhiPA3]